MGTLYLFFPARDVFMFVHLNEKASDSHLKERDGRSKENNTTCDYCHHPKKIAGDYPTFLVKDPFSPQRSYFVCIKNAQLWLLYNKPSWQIWFLHQTILSSTEDRHEIFSIIISIYLSIYLSISSSLYISAYLYLSVPLFICWSVSLSIYLSIYLSHSVYIYICVCVCVFVFVCVSVCVCVCVCECVYIYIYIYIHIYIAVTLLIYIYMCVCVCVCLWIQGSFS